MASTGIGVDIGATAIRVLVGSERKGVFRVERYVTIPVEEGQDPADLGAELGAELRRAKIKGDARCGLTGRDVVLRYTQVPPVPDWQLRQLMDFEINELVEQSGEPLAADFNVIPVGSDVGSDDTVLLALAKPAVLAEHDAVLGGAGLALRAYTPNPIALFNAYRKSGSENGTTLLLHVGQKNVDVAIVVDGELLFARNLSGGGESFDEALAASFNVSKNKARQLRHDFADVAPPEAGSRKQTSPQSEKVNRALAGALGQLFSMVQSSVMFARSQTGQNEVRVDRVKLSGTAAQIKGLDAWLKANLGVEVTRFDAFEAVDLSAAGGALDDDAERAAAIVALGLAIGSVSKDAYSLDILPAAAKRARTFKERTVFAIGAGVLALGLLGVYAMQASADEAAASSDLRAISSEADKLARRKKDFEELVVEREAQAVRLLDLEQRAIGSLAVSRTLALLQSHLPADLYVRSITTPRVADAELGIVGEPRPVVLVRGEGREGTDGLATIFNRFVEAVTGDELLPNRPKAATSPASAKKPFEWTLTLNFSNLPEPDAEETERGSE
jgi:type IV pilus assembly protein PilM